MFMGCWGLDTWRFLQCSRNRFICKAELELVGAQKTMTCKRLAERCCNNIPSSCLKESVWAPSAGVQACRMRFANLLFHLKPVTKQLQVKTKGVYPLRNRISPEVTAARKASAARCVQAGRFLLSGPPRSAPLSRLSGCWITPIEGGSGVAVCVFWTGARNSQPFTALSLGGFCAESLELILFDAPVRSEAVSCF